jgi:predicted hotdog family 3-hydroxylacyl-ACP dehydratase
VAVDPRIAALLPHAGRMCLLERILQWDEAGVTLATSTHRDPANPLATTAGLRAIHLCEYGAQAMAVHGGLTAEAQRQRARPGLLVSLRDVELHCRHVQGFGGDIEVAAHRLQDSDTALQYTFRVSHQGTLLARGRATVSITAAGVRP